MAIAALANSSARARKPGATRNKTTKKVTKNKTAKAAARKAQNKTAVRATLSSSAIKEVRNGARKELLAELKQKGVLTEQNKKQTKKAHKRGKKRNGLTSYLPSMPSLRNPTFRGLGNTVVTGAAIVGGGGVSTVIAAGLLALADWLLPTSWVNNTYYQRYGQSVATFVAAVFALPLILSVRIFNFIPPNAKTAATWGGVGFGLGQAFNELTGVNPYSTELGDDLVSGARNLFPSTGNKAADEAAKAVLKSGGTQADAAKAAAATMGAMRRSSDGGGYNYGRNRPPMVQTGRAF